MGQQAIEFINDDELVEVTPKSAETSVSILPPGWIDCGHGAPSFLKSCAAQRASMIFDRHL
jgi:hypothetical protein